MKKALFISGIDSFVYPYKNLHYNNHNINYYRGNSIILSDNESIEKYKYKLFNMKKYNRDFIVYTNNIESLDLLNNVNKFQFESVPIAKFFGYTAYSLLGYLNTKFDSVKYIDIENLCITYNKQLTYENNKNIFSLDSEIYNIIFNEIDNKIFDIDYIFYSMLEWLRFDINKTDINLTILNYIKNKYPNKHIYVGGIKNLISCCDDLKNYNIIIGNNLNDIDLNLKIQKISNIDSNNYNLKLHDEYEKTSFTDILKSYNIKTNKNILSKYTKHFIYSITDDSFCSGKCAFCGSANNIIKYEKSNILKRLDILKQYKDYGFTSFMLLDCSISDKIIFDLFCEYILKNNLKFDFLAGFKLSNITQEKIKILEEVGCKILNVGIETVDENHREYIQKKLSDEILLNNLNLLGKSNIFTFCNFILHMPYFNENEIQNITTFIDKNKSCIDDYICSLYFCADDSPFMINKNKFKIKTFKLNELTLYSENKRFNSVNKVYQKMADNIPNLLNSKINYNNFYRCLTHLIFVLYELLYNKQKIKKIYEEINQERKEIWI